MKQINYKKLIIPNIPYVFFVYLFDKVGQATRLAPGADISEKILNITQGFSEAFSNALPSVHPLDLLIGIVGAVVIRLIVYVKGKNAKKYRKGAEYGSARWGNAEDIKPYIDPDFQNNIILTQTERLIFFRQGKNTTSVRRISKENFGRRSEKPPPHSCETRSTRSYFFGFERKRTRAAFHNGRIRKRLFPFSSVRL